MSFFVIMGIIFCCSLIVGLFIGTIWVLVQLEFEGLRGFDWLGCALFVLLLASGLCTGLVKALGWLAPNWWVAA